MGVLIHPDALWLLLALPGMLALWWRTPAGVSRRGWWVTAGLRLGALALLAFSLAGPAQVTPGPDGARRLMVLADASLSVAPADAKQARELVAEAADQARAHGVAVSALAFARRTAPDVDALRGDRDATDLARALDDGLAALRSDETGAIVLATDGLHTTGDLDPAVQRAARAGVPVHVVPLEARPATGVGIARFEAPARAYAGDVLELGVTIRSSEQGAGWLTVARNDKQLQRTRVALARGLTSVTVKSTERDPAQVRFRARIEPELIADDLPEDDERLAVTDVRPVPRVLVVAHDAGLTNTLRAQGVAAEHVGPAKAPVDLARYAAVVVDDVVAKDLPAGFMPAVEVSTRDRGTGFFMIGGHQAFERGGYVGTPIERILPVDLMRVTQEAGAAVVVLVDQSWSMAGWPLHEGRRACKGLLKLLEGRTVAMLSFAAGVSEVFPLQAIGANRDALERAIDRIRPRGGTDLLAPLKEAERLLAGTGTGYVILLTDGEPEDKAGLVSQAARMAAKNIQVSTVRISKLPETLLLAQIARDGGGRYYQAADYEQLAKMFKDEATTITGGARTSRGEFAMQVVAPATIVRGFKPEQFPLFTGMNITRVKERAEPLLAVAPRSELSATQGALPLLAVWRAGLGRSLAFTSDSGGAWTAAWRGWSEHGRFWAQLVKGILLAEPTEFAVRAHVRDGTGAVTVDAIRADGRTLDMLPLEARVTGALPGAVTLAQQGPGRYVGRFDATRRGFYSVQVTRRDTGAAVGTVGLAQSDAGELEPRAADTASLARIASQTGGRVIGAGDLAAVVAAIPTTSRTQRREWSPGLTLAALFLFFLEVVLRRTGVFAVENAGVPCESSALAAAARAFERARALDEQGELRAAATHYLDAYRRYGRAGASERAQVAWTRYRRAEERSKEC